MFLIGAKEMFAEEKWKDSQEPLIHITHFRYTYFSKIPVIGKGKWNIVQYIFHNRAVTHNITFFSLLVIFRWVDSHRNDFGEEIPRTHLDCGGRAGAFHSKEERYFCFSDPWRCVKRGITSSQHCSQNKNLLINLWYHSSPTTLAPCLVKILHLK